MSLKQIAIRGFGWNVADKLTNHLGYLAVTVYLARVIGPESFGFIGMLTVFIILAESVVSGGFTAALVQRSNKLTEADACTVFWVNMGWGLAVYAGLALAAPMIAQFYRQPELTDIASTLFTVVVINALAVIARAKLTIAVDFKSLTIANTVGTFFSCSLAIFLAIKGYGYWSLVWLMVTKAAVTTAVLFWFCRWLPKLQFSRSSFSSLFGFGSKLMLAGFVATAVNNLYVLLIGRFFNATQVGYFTQATNLSNHLQQFITSSLQGVTYPIMTSIQEDRTRLVGIYKQLISITMLVSLPLLVGFAAVAEDFIQLFLGPEWMPTVPVLVALCLARTVTPISAINMNILNAIGRSDLFLKVDLSKLPLAIGCLLIALPYGIEGLAWAMVATSFIAFFMNAWYPGKLFDYGGRQQLAAVMPYAISSCIMFMILAYIPTSSDIPGLFLKILLGALIYVASLWISGDVWVRRAKLAMMTKMAKAIQIDA